MVEAWHLQSVYLGQGQGPNKPPQPKGANQQNQELVPVQPLPQQQPSSSESGSAEPIPPPPSQPVQLSQVPRAGTPRAPAQSTYVGQRPAGYVQSNYVGQGPQGQAGAKPAPKPSATSANAPGEQKYFGNNVVVAPADQSTPVQSQGRPAGAGTDYVQSVYLGQGPTSGQAGKPGQPGTKSLKSQASQETSVSPGKTAEEPSPGKLVPAPVGNQAELDRAAKEREKALEDQKRQLQEREEKEKAEARRLEAERKRLEEEKERLAREKEELDKEKERLAKLKAQKEKEAKEKEAKEAKDGKEAKEQVKEKDKEATKEVKAEPAEKNAAKAGQTKPNHKYAGGPSLNVERKEKLNVEVEPGKVVYSHPYDRQQIVDITLKNVCGEIVHYKVMATQPKFYRVKNKQNVIMPGQSAVAAVRLEILKNAAKSKKENHRIIIQTAVSKKAQEDKKFWRDIDGKKNRVQFSRLPVKLLLEGEQEANEDHDVEYDNGQPFIVEPESELIFRGPFDEPVTSPICAINNTDKFMFVKVLITNPDPFRVRPNVCTISPRSMQIFAAILEPIGAKELEKLQKKKNKFMLEYAESEKNDQDAETFFHKHPKNVQCIKLTASIQND